MTLSYIAGIAKWAKQQQKKLARKLDKSPTRLWCRCCGGVDGVDLEMYCPCFKEPVKHIGNTDLLIKVSK